jgi:hypothetical protein
MLSILIKREKEYGQNRGVIPHLVDDGLSILQYADDTVIFMYHDLSKLKICVSLNSCLVSKLTFTSVSEPCGRQEGAMAPTKRRMRGGSGSSCYYMVQ